jgi:hypothetical protein
VTQEFTTTLYRDQGGTLAGVLQLSMDNVFTAAELLGGQVWHNGPTNHVAGLIFGEYDAQEYVPLGWWVVQHGGRTEYLCQGAFEAEWVEA